MRVRQTARKSTATPARSVAGSSAASTASATASNTSTSSSDPVRNRMRALLQTKRKSATPTSRVKNEHSGGPGGKTLPYTTSSSQAVKVRPRKKYGDNILREIRRLQNSYQLLLPRLPFHRVVREVTQGIAKERAYDQNTTDFKYQAAALVALQEAAEAYLCQFFEDSYLCTIHAKRVTLFVSDMQLCRRLQRRPGIY